MLLSVQFYVLLCAMKELTRKDFIKWGKVGGKKRAEVLTPERRIEIARLAGSAPKKKAKRK